MHGEVRDIKIRATRITTNDNIDILVPNSEFVTGRVVNWTHRDVSRRMRVPFGVAYGSDKELVKKAALEAAARSRRSPWRRTARAGPQVWLTEFGDSSLNFELVVWLTAEATKRPSRCRPRTCGHCTPRWRNTTSRSRSRSATCTCAACSACEATRHWLALHDAASPGVAGAEVFADRFRTRATGRLATPSARASRATMRSKEVEARQSRATSRQLGGKIRRPPSSTQAAATPVSPAGVANAMSHPESPCRTQAIRCKPRLLIRATWSNADFAGARRAVGRVYGAGYSQDMLRGQLSHFPAKASSWPSTTARIVGHCATFRIDEDTAMAPHTWREITGGGFAVAP